MCVSCVKHGLYLLLIGFQRFFLKTSSQFRWTSRSCIQKSSGFYFIYQNNYGRTDYVSHLCCYHWLLLTNFENKWLQLNWSVAHGMWCLPLELRHVPLLWFGVSLLSNWSTILWSYYSFSLVDVCNFLTISCFVGSFVTENAMILHALLLIYL